LPKQVKEDPAGCSSPRPVLNHHPADVLDLLRFLEQAEGNLLMEVEFKNAETFVNKKTTRKKVIFYTEE
jgi:hypothetical protein